MHLVAILSNFVRGLFADRRFESLIFDKDDSISSTLMIVLCQRWLKRFDKQQKVNKNMFQPINSFKRRQQARNIAF